MGFFSPTGWAQSQAVATNPPGTMPATAAASAAPASNLECVPACRAGYLCMQGQCVSACNPPCAANETCSNGQCLMNAQPAQAPAMAPGVAPGVAMQPAGTMSLATPEPAPAVPRDEYKIKTFSFVPRIGLQAGGSGTLERKCEGSSCISPTSASADYDMKSAFAVGADFMFKVGDLVRMGPGLLYTNTMDVKGDGATSSDELGSIVDLNFVFELVPRVSPTVWLVPRAQLGLSFLNTSGATMDSQNVTKNDCTNSAMSGCDSVDNPHLGYNLGLGFGAMFAVSPSVRLRVDTLYQYYSINLYNVSATDANATLTLDASGSRYFLFAGMEI